MRINNDGTITDYIEALDQEVTFSPESWERELKLRTEIRNAHKEYINSLVAQEEYELLQEKIK